MLTTAMDAVAAFRRTSQGKIGTRLRSQFNRIAPLILIAVLRPLPGSKRRHYSSPGWPRRPEVDLCMSSHKGYLCSAAEASLIARFQIRSDGKLVQIESVTGTPRSSYGMTSC